MRTGVYAAALASLPQAGPLRLQRLLSDCGPTSAWKQVEHKNVPTDVANEELRDQWSAHAAETDLSQLSDYLEEHGIRVTTPADADHPEQFVDDIDPAPVIFRKGRPADRDVPAVAIVGTRRCSPTGRSVAYELGAGLADSGVMVVSGLALGIDGAAHRGALSVDGVPPVGVVGSGLNVVYPRGNSDLWCEMGKAGTLFSEVPLDGKPEPWRFPARNRLLAALSDVVVVVESKEAGGSMHTVEESIRRGITVMAVPGSVRNPAAAGTNRLISDGCAPACGVEDILTATGLACSGHSSGNLPVVPAPAVDSPVQELDGLQLKLLEATDDNPVSIGTLVSRVGKPVPVVLKGIARLESMGLLVLSEGRVIRG